ncbi:hypothetical protein PRUPE_2G070800 [Prunus persica]|uniref:Uncharacterized protein n=1 Tax=Prunus persica TaxID=3760 RepID=A0A251QCH4_PRUPE|nr:hypothetical protein PRUPE_2G070800 [Prunus persica]
MAFFECFKKGTVTILEDESDNLDEVIVTLNLLTFKLPFFSLAIPRVTLNPILQYPQSQSLFHPSHLHHLSSSPISSLCSISDVIYS